MDKDQYDKILAEIRNSRQKQRTEDNKRLNDRYESIIRKMWIDAKQNLRLKKLEKLYEKDIHDKN